MLTTEEFEKAYGDVELTFSSYYKFAFTFSGTAPDGVTITADLGGNSDDIYRESIDNNEKRKVGVICQTWRKVQAFRGEDLIFNYDDY